MPEEAEELQPIIDRMKRALQNAPRPFDGPPAPTITGPVLPWRTKPTLTPCGGFLFAVDADGQAWAVRVGGLGQTIGYGTRVGPPTN